MKILAIDTSCDETAAAVTSGVTVLSSVVWSQASAHAKFGGVMPSLAQRMHEERIDWVINEALKKAGCKTQDIDAVAVTIGPGLSIALGVGVKKAKEIAKKYNKSLLAVNHVEAHLLSPLVKPSSKKEKGNSFDTKIIPSYGLCVSGKNTIFVLIEKPGKYKILADLVDDALGEALDKAARMLGLGYPGGAILEKMARKGNIKKFTLPIPLVGQEKRQIFSYSGLKTSFYRLIESQKTKYKNFPDKEDIYDLAACFQNVAFKHIERVLEFSIANLEFPKARFLLLGGGVAANIEFRKRLRKLLRKFGIKLLTPYTEKLCGDNAAMIGATAYLNPKRVSLNKIDREPRLKL